MSAAMEVSVARLFERYERAFLQGLAGEADMNEIASLYASEFIAASPAGVATGRNDDALRDAMAQGHARYRALGLADMRVRHIRCTAIDDLHCLAHVGWRSRFARPGAADVNLDFEVHYLVERLDEEARVFGWVTGDEEAVLRAHGIV